MDRSSCAVFREE